LHDYARANHGDLLDKINETGDYNDEIVGELKVVTDAFAEKGAY
jgi:F-type H+-transporting ATPase subunit alpha